jgi:hypothetical protein
MHSVAGVPVFVSGNQPISVLVEIAILNKDYVVGCSLGTHFFNDLIESETLYLGDFAVQKEQYTAGGFLQQAPNELLNIYPDAQNWTITIKVIDPLKSIPAEL